MEERMMEENRILLMEYVELLLKLQTNGINCKKEINEALKALHEGMGFEKSTLKGIKATSEDGKSSFSIDATGTTTIQNKSK
jgi:hypothetical protein